MAEVSHDAVVHQTKPALINYVAAIFAATGSFLFGYDSGIIGSVISVSYDQFHSYYNAPTAGVIGAIVSLFAAGAFFGAIMAGYTADKIGRKRTIQLGSLIAITGCAIQTGALNVGALIAGRFIAGWSIGVLSCIVPMYQAEISPPHARGLLSGWTQLMIGFGFFVANWVGYGCAFLRSSAQFRVPLGIQIVPALALFVGMFVLPYSPRWLAKQGRHEESRQTLVRLHGGRRTAKLDVIEAEFQEMLVQIEWEKENLATTPLDLMKGRPNIHRTLCGTLVQAMCQWTGINVASYFGPAIYASLGFDDQRQLLINGIYGAWGLVITAIFIHFIVDKLGRRPPLIYGAFAMAICLAWQAAIGAQFKKGAGNYSMGLAGVASFFCFSWAFSWSYGPVSWTYQSEIFPMHLRAYGCSASTAMNWLNNTIIGQVTPIGLQQLDWKYFLLFISTNTTNGILAYFLFPETKGRTLEEIGVLFGDTDVRTLPQTMQAGADITKTTSMGEEKGETDHVNVHERV